MTVEYRVQLEAFDGPLDLLLYLIRRAEVDIQDIPIATVADQYLEFLRQIDRIDIDMAGEFLVMAATLMEIKSRMLMPSEPEAQARGDGAAAQEDARPAADPRAELVRQLLAYKRFRDAASALEHRLDEWQKRFPSARALVQDAGVKDLVAAIQGEDGSGEGESRGAVDVEDLTLIDLAEAFRRIAESVNFDRLGEHQVEFDDTPLELHAEDILDRLTRDAAEGGRGFTLQAILGGRTRAAMIGLFLATLELVRQRKVRVRQEIPGGEILIAAREESETGGEVDAGGGVSTRRSDVGEEGGAEGGSGV